MYTRTNITYRVNKHVLAKYRERTCKDPTVVLTNIVDTSNHTLTSSEIKLLNRLGQIISEFDQWVRKIRFRYFFRASKRKMSRYRRKSNAQALRSSNKMLESTLDIIVVGGLRIVSGSLQVTLPHH